MPELGNPDGRGINYQQAVSRLGVQDWAFPYHRKNRNNRAAVKLLFDDNNREIGIQVVCVEHSNNIDFQLLVNGSEVPRQRTPALEELIVTLHKVRIEFIRPLGTITPAERELSHQELTNSLNTGHYAETWRNQLDWLNDGRPPELFQSVIRTIRDYFPDIDVYPPRRDRKTNPSNVLVEYRENGVDYDISFGGGGFRTIFSLASVIELSPASLLLFDEPDAHLHSSLQRQVAKMLAERSGLDKQIVISTHAPDVIDEVPIDSLRWIQRDRATGERCDHVGKTLVSLGAISHTQAMQYLGADIVICVEDKTDRNVMSELLSRCGKPDLIMRARFALIKGFGDIQCLPDAVRVLKAILPRDVPVVAIRGLDHRFEHALAFPGVKANGNHRGLRGLSHLEATATLAVCSNR